MDSKIQKGVIDFHVRSSRQKINLFRISSSCVSETIYFFARACVFKIKIHKKQIDVLSVRLWRYILSFFSFMCFLQFHTACILSKWQNGRWVRIERPKRKRVRQTHDTCENLRDAMCVVDLFFFFFFEVIKSRGSEKNVQHFSFT